MNIVYKKYKKHTFHMQYWFRQSFAKFRQVSPSFATFRKVSPSVARVSPSFAKFRQVSPSFARASPSFVKCRKVSPSFAELLRASPSSSESIKINFEEIVTKTCKIYEKKTYKIMKIIKQINKTTISPSSRPPGAKTAEWHFYGCRPNEPKARKGNVWKWQCPKITMYKKY